MWEKAETFCKVLVRDLEDLLGELEMPFLADKYEKVLFFCSKNSNSEMSVEERNKLQMRAKLIYANFFGEGSKFCSEQRKRLLRMMDT